MITKFTPHWQITADCKINRQGYNYALVFLISLSLLSFPNNFTFDKTKYNIQFLNIENTKQIFTFNYQNKLFLMECSILLKDEFQLLFSLISSYIAQHLTGEYNCQTFILFYLFTFIVDAIFLKKVVPGYQCYL